jgi:hypothetical protein
MNKRFFPLLFFATMLSMPMFSQWSVGLSGGYAYNYFDYDPQYMSGLHFNGRHGVSGDLSVNYRFNDWFGLLTGVSYQQKGYVMNGSYIPNGSTEPYVFYGDFRRNDNYWIIPVAAEFLLGNEKWEGFLDVGGYSGYWCSSYYSFNDVMSIHLGYYTVSGKAPRAFDEKVDRRVELGAMLSLGVKWNLLRRLSLFAAAKTYFALTPQQKDYQLKHFPSRNITITTQLGLLYNFK